MIEIRLTGDDALAYLADKAMKDDKYDKLVADYTALQEKYSKALSNQKEETVTVSNRILDDSKKAKELDTKEPKISIFKAKKKEPKQDTSSTWEAWELDIIEYATNSNTKSINSLEYLTKKLINRSTSAIRSKLSTLGISVKSGRLKLRG